MSYTTYPVTLAAGAQTTLAVAGRTVRVLEASTKDFRVTLNNGAESIVPPGTAITLDEGVSSVRLRNTGTDPLALVLAVAAGTVADDRLTASAPVDIANWPAGFNVNNLPTVQAVRETRGGTFATWGANVSGTASQIVGANATRRSVTIQNRGPDPVVIGNAGILPGDGPEIPYGGSLTLSNITAGIYAVTAGGTANVRMLEERD